MSKTVLCEDYLFLLVEGAQPSLCIRIGYFFFVHLETERPFIVLCPKRICDLVSGVAGYSKWVMLEVVATSCRDHMRRNSDHYTLVTKIALFQSLPVKARRGTFYTKGAPPTSIVTLLVNRRMDPPFDPNISIFAVSDEPLLDIRWAAQMEVTYRVLLYPV
ncbi:hypothetical protein J6590_096390 [Homalodisca vitripennis]|nr:hypothetical protein J6590_096390 [Homalodisca vitripennis]